jgi:hypothetical protein
MDTDQEYRVFGHTVVTVTTVVTAKSESEAYKKASEKLPSLTAYGGNGGTDKLVGVEDENDTVAADENIVYDDIERL